MKKAELITQTCEFSGRVITVNRDTVCLPDGHQMDMEIVHHSGGSAIVAIDEQQRVCLIRQYRYAVADWIWEIPAGKIDAGETPESTARKELQEEAGVLATSWSSLGKMYATPGYCDETVYLYLAKKLQSTTIQHEPGELIDIHWLPFSEAIEWALKGKINDAKTLVALFRASEILKA
ncbi:MAG: NUDIX hydrolase [Gammaproteobacteria bacterium]|nr:NUDIX hydrolase [Gammaproteobacteria bacterium]